MNVTRIFVLYSAIFLCLILIICHSQVLYDVHIDHVELPERDTFLIAYKTIRVKKFNRTQYTLDGYFDLLHPFSDDIFAIIDVYGYAGNEYVRLFQRNVTEMCKFVQNDKIVMNKILNQTSLGLNYKCPVPAGSVHCYNTRIPMEPIMPMAWMGMFRKFKLSFTYYLEGKMVTRFIVHLVMEKIKFLL